MKWFVNMRIKSKLLVSFIVIILLAILLGLLSMLSMNDLDKSYSYILGYPQKRLELLMQINTNASDMRRTTTAVTLNLGNNGVVENYRGQFNGYYQSTIDCLDSYLVNLNSDAVMDAATKKADIENAQAIGQLFESYKQAVDTAMDYAIAGELEATNDTFLSGASFVAGATESMAKLIEAENAYAKKVSDANTKQKDETIITVIIEVAVIVVISIIIALYIAGLIAKPIGFLSFALEQFGFKGSTKLPPDVAKSAMECMARKDEIGKCANAFGAVMNYVQIMRQALDKVADGDLTADVKIMSEDDSMSIALDKMIANLNSLFSDIRKASDQVTAGASQVAMGAQQLASGSSEQAASIEEFSATLSELQTKTNLNAENSLKASEVNDETDKCLQDSISSMSEMLRAMREIDESSSSITKIIKVIDDIAFQTNILALNAAVEAARAGQHGKGFAVVADEVRNLASKSAAAAKETAALIEGSSQSVNEGNQIVSKTNADLEAAARNAKESTLLITQVTGASNEQAGFLQNINSGIAQISTVVQEISATAEQSAAAAQEMSAQATVLNDILSRFILANK